MDARDSTILTDRRGAGLWITLNRPAALNALSAAMITDVTRALDAAEADPMLRAIVLTGAGRAFCAGADLKDARAMTETADATAAFLAAARGLMDRIERFRLPVIAAVNGLAIAAGIEFLLACDLVFAAKSARIGDGHAKFGLLPGAGGSVRLPRKIGPARAKYLMFTAEYLPAATLLDWGLVHEVAPDGALAGAVEAFVAKLADKSPLVLARMKRLVDDGLGQPLEVALRGEQVMSALHVFSADRAEGLAAFAEKRTPVFNGR